MRKSILAALAVIALGVLPLVAQSGATITFTNTGQAGYGKSGQFTVPVDPYPSGGTIYYGPQANNPGYFNIWFSGMTPALEVAEHVLGIKTRLVQPTSVYRGCPIGALDRLEITNAPSYDSDGTLDYTVNAEQYIGNYYWSNGGGGRGGASSGCFALIMPAGTVLPDGTVTKGGFTSVRYPQ
jgi:hypothetical protein